MNRTSPIQAVCDICQISYGLSSADRRAIIVMVVLAGIALILCYVGTLWFAIRTRFIPDEKSDIIVESVHTNEAFNNNEDTEEYVSKVVNPTAPEPVVFTLENENERF